MKQKKDKPKTLEDVLKENLEDIKSMEGDDEKLSRLFDKIDPEGEYPVDYFKKVLRKITGVELKQYLPRK